jgi:hypothetical protein
VNFTATQQYIEKADCFLEGMRLLADDIPAYRSGVGLLAIHSAISLGDAIKVGLTGKRGKYQDHSQALTCSISCAPLTESQTLKE